MYPKSPENFYKSNPRPLMCFLISLVFPLILLCCSRDFPVMFPLIFPFLAPCLPQISLDPTHWPCGVQDSAFEQTTTSTDPTHQQSRCLSPDLQLRKPQGMLQQLRLRPFGPLAPFGPVGPVHGFGEKTQRQVWGGSRLGGLGPLNPTESFHIELLSLSLCVFFLFCLVGGKGGGQGLPTSPLSIS